MGDVMKARFLVVLLALCSLMPALRADALAVAATVPVGSHPELVAVNPIKNFVYVASYGSPGPGGDVVTVLNAAGPVPVPIGTIPVGVDPYGIDVNILTNKIYVANFGSGSVSVLNEATAPPTVTTIPGIPGAAGVAVNSVTNLVYVISATGTLFVINGLTDTIQAVTSLASPGSGTFLVEINPVLNRVYVPEYAGSELHVLDGLTLSPIATVSGFPPFAFGSPLGGVAVNPLTQDLYLTNEKGGIYLIDGLTHAIKDSAPIGIPGSLPFGTWGVEVNVLKGHVYVVQFHTNTVHVLNASTLDHLGFVATGPSTVSPTTGPHFSALNPLTGQLFVTNLLAGTVSVISDP